jgi:hypothetical protein
VLILEEHVISIRGDSIFAHHIDWKHTTPISFQAKSNPLANRWRPKPIQSQKKKKKKKLVTFRSLPSLIHFNLPSNFSNLSADKRVMHTSSIGSLVDLRSPLHYYGQRDVLLAILSPSPNRTTWNRQRSFICVASSSSSSVAQPEAPSATVEDAGASRKLKKYSRVTQPKSQGGSQAVLYGVGLSEEDMSKPQVGISSVWYEGNTCNMHLLQLAEAVKEGVTEAGMVGFHFNTVGEKKNVEFEDPVHEDEDIGANKNNVEFEDPVHEHEDIGANIGRVVHEFEGFFGNHIINGYVVVGIRG